LVQRISSSSRKIPFILLPHCAINQKGKGKYTGETIKVEAGGRIGKK
jgi:hypothetical protein